MLSFWGNTSTNIGLWKVSAGGGDNSVHRDPVKSKMDELEGATCVSDDYLLANTPESIWGGGVENLGLERT